MTQQQNALELKLLVESLPEFRYSFGDPRPILLRYLLTIGNTTSYFAYLKPDKQAPQAKKEALKMSDVFVHTCGPPDDSGNTKRLVRDPDAEPKNKLRKAIRSVARAPIAVIPFMMKTKTTCKAGVKLDSAKHLTYVLYNKLTRELERIDMKKYHIRGFKIKLAFKAMKQKFPDLVAKTIGEKSEGPAIKFLNEHDVTPKFMANLGLSDSSHEHARTAFPLFIMAYMRLRCEFPEEASPQIYNRLDKLSRTKIIEYWRAYVEYRKNNVFASCGDGRIKNLETGRCMKESSKLAESFFIEPPPRTCKGQGQVYDMLRNRCVKKGKEAVIDIGLEQVKNFNVAKDAKVKHLGMRDTTLSAVNFVLSKYNNAFLVNPSDTEGTNIGNRKYAFVWRFNADKNAHDFKTPRGLKNKWAEGMLSPARFLIILISLSIPGSGHANALIYDKARNEMERFDGLGASANALWNTQGLDEKIGHLFTQGFMRKSVPSGFKYFTPLDYCPRKLAVFQTRELDEIGSDDLKGNCAVWRLWYIDVRLANPHLSREQVVSFAMKKIENVGSFPRFIKAYQAYVASSAGLKTPKKSPKKTPKKR